MHVICGVSKQAECNLQQLKYSGLHEKIKEKPGPRSDCQENQDPEKFECLKIWIKFFRLKAGSDSSPPEKPNRLQALLKNRISGFDKNAGIPDPQPRERRPQSPLREAPHCILLALCFILIRLHTKTSYKLLYAPEVLTRC